MKGVENMAITSNNAIEERRREIQKRRKEQKIKRRKAAAKRFLIFLCVVAVITLAILSLTVFFPVEKITVASNNSPYSSEEIIKASGVQKGKNLWMTGFNAEEEIPVKLPFIAEATVQRKFPSSIIIKATVAKPVYLIQTKNEYYVCDAEFKVLEIKKEPSEGLVTISGIEVSKTKVGNKATFKDEPKYEMLKTIFANLKEKSITVNSADVTELMEMTVRVENRFNVHLGSSAYLDLKIAHLAGMLKEVDEDIVGSIDLSDYSPENDRGILTRE